MRAHCRGAIFKMLSLKVITNASDTIGNAMAYVEGVAKSTRTYEVDQAVGQAVTSIAQKSLAAFIDTEARLSPKSLHHVYEWGRTGASLARLWTIKGEYKTGAIVLSSDFKQSRTYVPIKNGTTKRHKFTYKAEVMETGKPVRISAKNARALFFYSKDGTPVFIPRGRVITVKTPGGKEVRGAYQKTMFRFVNSSRLNSDMAKSNLFKEIERAQALAGNQMPKSVTGKSSRASFERIGETTASKHIKQVARTYQKAKRDVNG